MGNCCFCSNKVELKDYVTDDERLRPEGKLTLFFSEELNCYMLGFEIKVFRIITLGCGLRKKGVLIFQSLLTLILGFM